MRWRRRGVGGAWDGCALWGRWRRCGVAAPGPWGRWGRWRRRWVAALWGEWSKGLVGSTRMEAPWGHWGVGAEGWLHPGMGSGVVGGAVGPAWDSDGGSVRWVEPGIGEVNGGAVGWRRRGVGPGGWSKGWVGSSCPAEQGAAPPPAAARPPCPPQVLPKGYVMPVLLQLGPSRLLPWPGPCAGPLLIHAPAGSRTPALGPGPLGASTCWHHYFDRIRGSTSSFTHPFLPSKVLN